MSDIPAPGGVARGTRGTSAQALRRRVTFHLLDVVQRTRGGGVLRFSVGGQGVGYVVASDGRVCLAVADAADVWPRHVRGQDALDDVALMAAERGASLGVVLREQAPTDVRRFLEALHAHTVEGLAAIAEACAGTMPDARLEGARNDYDPALTFAPVSLFVALANLGPPRPLDFARRVHDACAEPDGARLLLARDPEPGVPPFPIAALGLDHLSLRELLGLARGGTESCRREPGAGSGAGYSLAIVCDAGMRWVVVPSEHHVALVGRSARDDIDPLVSRIVALAA